MVWSKVAIPQRLPGLGAPPLRFLSSSAIRLGLENIFFKVFFWAVGICPPGPGLPLEILAQEFWVPGSTVRAECPQYLGKETFSEILTATEETACLYAVRASRDPWYSRTMFCFNLCCMMFLFYFPPQFGHESDKGGYPNKTSQNKTKQFPHVWHSVFLQSIRTLNDVPVQKLPWRSRTEGLWILGYRYSYVLLSYCLVLFLFTATLQKSSQLSDEQHYLLFDIVCLWVWLLPKLVKNYPSEIVEKHEELFHKGCLVAIGVFFWGG